MKTILKLLAPYLAVVPFWCIWPNGWIAILAYHAQIVIWRWPVLGRLRRPQYRGGIGLALPAIAAGPLLYVLLPTMVRTDLPAWLSTHHLSGVSLGLMVPYFGLLHPVIEQFHWHDLRERTAWSHLAFAGYHVIVLSSLLTIPWLTLCFAVLLGTSLAWKLMAHTTRSLMVPAVSHILADLGIIVAAWLSST